MRRISYINQLGYFANGSKVAMLTDMDADTYTLRLARNNQVVFSARQIHKNVELIRRKHPND